jgi:leucyl-tRNA synthetase
MKVEINNFDFPSHVLFYYSIFFRREIQKMDGQVKIFYIMRIDSDDLPKYISFARELRKNQTEEEKVIWEQLRNRRLLGFKFLRQHPVIFSQINNRKSFYIADFYCAEKKLVVEIDGLIHTSQIEEDKARDIVMNEIGLQVIRITNEEVNRNIYAVLKKIKAILKQ